MHRCLELARLGLGMVSPNPIVGAVLVHGDVIIGEGYHMQFGQPHAEVNCINNVAEHFKSLIPESTLYVSLEPCSHFGKTPPCTDLILKHEIKRVVIGVLDPFVQVNGKGAEKLRQSGVEVTTGVLEDLCAFENRRFFTFHTQQRPYVILKWAQSVDGFLAGKDFKAIAISHDETNRLSHRWRSEEDAITVGFNTALHDNPSLTNRYWKGKNPVRIFFDSELTIPSSHQLYNREVRTIVFNTIKSAIDGNIDFFKLSKGKSNLKEGLQYLFENNISSVIVEGGSQLLQSFIDQSLWDEARIITNPSMNIFEGIVAPTIHKINFTLKESYAVSNDNIEVYENANKIK